jgi:hypothetical protein
MNGLHPVLERVQELISLKDEYNRKDGKKSMLTNL